MIKKFLVTIFLIIVVIFAFITTCFAYEDELFEFDLPSHFANMSYQDMYMFADTTADEGRGFLIVTEENTEMKKSVWDISDEDLDMVIRRMGYSVTVLDTDKRAKLGKEKAIKLTVASGGEYMDMYVLASNHYVYMVMFLGDSQADLNSADYQMVKDSFKLKDATTNYKAIFTVGFIIIIVVVSLFSARRRGKHMNIGNNMDYKNMTEDDFNIKQ